MRIASLNTTYYLYSITKYQDILRNCRYSVHLWVDKLLCTKCSKFSEIAPCVIIVTSVFPKVVGRECANYVARSFSYLKINKNKNHLISDNEGKSSS